MWWLLIPAAAVVAIVLRSNKTAQSTTYAPQAAAATPFTHAGALLGSDTSLAGFTTFVGPVTVQGFQLALKDPNILNASPPTQQGINVGSEAGSSALNQMARDAAIGVYKGSGSGVPPPPQGLQYVYIDAQSGHQWVKTIKLFQHSVSTGNGALNTRKHTTVWQASTDPTTDTPASDPHLGAPADP